MYYNEVKKSLFKLVESNRCPQAFIFFGKNMGEIEKLSKEFSLKILGLSVGNPIDIIEVGINNKKGIFVDDIRNIKSEILKKPDKSKGKVVIIYNADRMNVKAQNAFLKSLEDCINVFIILVVRNISRIISTVISRCLLIRFGMMDIEGYVNGLSEFNFESEDTLIKLYSQTGGDLDVSKSILEKRIIYKMYLHIIELLESLFCSKLSETFEIGTQINNYKEEIDMFLNIFLDILRDMNLYLEIQDTTLFKNKFFEQDIVRICKYISVRHVYYILNELYKFRVRMECNLNVEMCYKSFILKITEAKY